MTLFLDIVIWAHVTTGFVGRAARRGPGRPEGLRYDDRHFSRVSD